MLLWRQLDPRLPQLLMLRLLDLHLPPQLLPLQLALWLMPVLLAAAVADPLPVGMHDCCERAGTSRRMRAALLRLRLLGQKQLLAAPAEHVHA